MAFHHWLGEGPALRTAALELGVLFTEEEALGRLGPQRPGRGRGLFPPSSSTVYQGLDPPSPVPGRASVSQRGSELDPFSSYPDPGSSPRTAHPPFSRNILGSDPLSLILAPNNSLRPLNNGLTPILLPAIPATSPYGNGEIISLLEL